METNIHKFEPADCRTHSRAEYLKWETSCANYYARWRIHFFSIFTKWHDCSSGTQRTAHIAISVKWNPADGTALLLFQSSLQKVVLLSTCHFLFSSSLLHALSVLLIPSLFDLHFPPLVLIQRWIQPKVESHFQTPASDHIWLQRWAETHIFSF